MFKKRRNHTFHLDPKAEQNGKQWLIHPTPYNQYHAHNSSHNPVIQPARLCQWPACIIFRQVYIEGASVELIETPILRVECLDHHLSLVPVGYHQSSCVEDHVHCVDYSVEAAGCSSLLREPNDAEWLFLTMLNHCNDLCGKGYFFQIQN